MDRPRIGIPLCLDDQGRWREGYDYQYIDRRYADAIDRAGGLPLQLPIQADPVALVEGLEGLLIPGGDDFPSDRPLPEGVQLTLVAETQLAFDEALCQAALARGIPILGICYGMQLMVRTTGGHLEPHLPSAKRKGAPDAAPPGPLGEHRLRSAERHTIEVESGSRLNSILEPSARRVNSLHHQAVREAGPEFQVVARASDGVIEAVESVDPRQWGMGVQWHPEKMDDDGSQRLFAVFVEACAGNAGLGRSAS